MSEEKKAEALEELSRKLDLVMKRLDAIENIVSENPDYAELAAFPRLARGSVGLYEEPLKMLAGSKPIERYVKGRFRARLQAKLILRAKEVKVGEDVNLKIELVNSGEAPYKTLPNSGNGSLLRHASN